MRYFQEIPSNILKEFHKIFFKRFILNQLVHGFSQEHLMNTLHPPSDFSGTSFWNSLSDFLENSFRDFYISSCLCYFIYFLKHFWRNSSRNFVTYLRNFPLNFSNKFFYFFFKNVLKISPANCSVSSKAAITEEILSQRLFQKIRSSFPLELNFFQIFLETIAWISPEVPSGFTPFILGFSWAFILFLRKLGFIQSIYQRFFQNSERFSEQFMQQIFFC